MTLVDVRGLKMNVELLLKPCISVNMGKLSTWKPMDMRPAGGWHFLAHDRLLRPDLL